MSVGPAGTPHKVSGATPKGVRRRHALSCAAADLLVEGGFDAVRHRAVATRAGLPLASTTYYFESLDDLIACAVEVLGHRELEIMRGRVDGMGTLHTDLVSTVELIVDLLIGPDDGVGEGRERLIARYERFVASARHPELREVQLRLRAQIDDLLTDVLRRAGRTVHEQQLRRIVAVVDGAVVGALGEVDPEPRAMARSMLLEVIDVVAPAG
ncbi:TetR family transcriptional regulator C-terminal domain-containing protein [Rhodococcus sp. BP-252]|nr:MULTISPECIES: TetR family transcriptional regulator C-terminal domain-containing protein [unclassified Rhodococcus (in: high G+C Gram-positive bacteria)]MBY6412788.1 TetR family transcriptional regulator C-terminal domain-containing protein [Rhodococcus sp. BP-320]MBY6417414.1 TetR family transcriptional regulator C-terminal domain-containing protein [Rhodococcus sp. BP-321]MBY6421808.1 TetR family transcriptional regulator C-terminal domain-containing protein [Rhodococcus sp. BP-324]MBY6427